MPYGYQIWKEGLLTKVLCIAGVKGHAGVSRGQPEMKLLRNALWLLNFVRKNPKTKFNALLGSKVMQGSAGVNQARGQFTWKWPMATKFGRKNTWPKCNALLGSKVMLGSEGVNKRSNCLAISYGYQIWEDEPLCNALLGSKVMQVSAAIT